MFRNVLVSLLVLMASLWADSRIAGYFPYWLQYSQFTPEDVRYEFLTEIRYVSLIPSESGELVSPDESDLPNLEKLAELADKNKVDFVITIGGVGNEDAMKALESEEILSAFVKSAKENLDKYKGDAIELDWISEEESDINLLKKIAKALKNEGISVYVNLNSDGSKASTYGTDFFSDLTSASIYFTDQMSEDISEVSPNANLKKAKEVIQAYIDAGLSAEKIVPIIPMYGKSFYKAQGLGSSYEGVGSGNEGVLSYKDLMKAFDSPDYKVSFDEDSWSEVAVSATETIVFNGIPSFREFAKYVKESNLGGLALYDLSGDHKEPIVSLMVTIGQVLRPDVNYQPKKRKK